MRGPSTGFWLEALLAVAGIVCYPTDALAFGPAAHVDLAMQVLAGAAVALPAVRRLLREFPLDFLYGNIAPDMVVGKSFVNEIDHCHNAAVARRLLLAARDSGPRREAFMLGYLAHLAADAVAHNRYVPCQLVRWYETKGVGHLYWEARFDRKIVELRPEVAGTLQALSKRSFAEHNCFLGERLAPALFSHGVSARIYKYALALQRCKDWNRALGRIDDRSKLTLPRQDALKWRRTTMALVARVLDDPDGDSLGRLDPTGRAMLARAAADRSTLRRDLRRRRGLFGEAARSRPETRGKPDRSSAPDAPSPW